MKKELITQLHKRFEDYAHNNNGIEYWLARELQELLGYMEWRNFSEEKKLNGQVKRLKKSASRI